MKPHLAEGNTTRLKNVLRGITQSDLSTFVQPLLQRVVSRWLRNSQWHLTSLARRSTREALLLQGPLHRFPCGSLPAWMMVFLGSCGRVVILMREALAVASSGVSHAAQLVRQGLKFLEERLAHLSKVSHSVGADMLMPRLFRLVLATHTHTHTHAGDRAQKGRELQCGHAFSPVDWRRACIRGSLPPPN
eukprot:2092826-Amphidinium_carterae.1